MESELEQGGLQNPSKAAVVTKRLLEDSIMQILRLNEDEVEESVRAFNSFQKGVSRTSNNHEATSEQIFGDLEPKVPVLRFLAHLHGKKRLLRRQIAAVVVALMHSDSWLLALRGDAALCVDWPEDLRSCVPDREVGRPSALRSEPEFKRQASDVSVNLEAVPKSANKSYTPRTNEIREAVAAAKAAAQQRDREIAMRRRNTRAPGMDTIRHLETSKSLMEKMRYNVGDEVEDAATAFENLRKAVHRVEQVRSQEDTAALNAFEPKIKALEFLVDLHEQKRKFRSRILYVLVRLLNYEPWRDAASAVPTVFALVSDLGDGVPRYLDDEDVLGSPETGMSRRQSEQAPSESPSTSTSTGVLRVRVFSAHRLSASLLTRPCVQITVSGCTQRTEASGNARNPRWNAAPFVFEAVPQDAIVTLEVLNADSRTGNALGSAFIPVSAAPTHADPPSERCSLVGPAGGELELQLSYLTSEPAVMQSYSVKPRQLFPKPRRCLTPGRTALVAAVLVIVAFAWYSKRRNPEMSSQHQLLHV